MTANGTAGTGVEVYEGALLQPAAPLPDIAEQFRQYDELCKLLLEDDDWQTKGVPRPFLKRSGWRKLATAMGVTLERRRDHIAQDEGGQWWALVEYRATAPNGRFADAMAACHQGERKWAHVPHDVIATADTRAKSRACADLFGLGQLSAEEVDAGGEPGEVPPASAPTWGSGAALKAWDSDLKAFRASVGRLAASFGGDADVLRHDIVHRATKGRTSSSAELTKAELVDCWAEYRIAKDALSGQHG